MRVSRRTTSIIAAALVVLVLTALAALVGTSTGQASSKATKPAILAALVSDIGKFNDRSFNQIQLDGLEPGEGQARVRTMRAAVELAFSDYIPNLTAAVRAQAEPRHRGRLPARGATRTRSRRSSRRRNSRSPTTPPRSFADKKGKRVKNVDGPHLRGQRVRLPRRRASPAQMAKKHGGKQDRRRRRAEDPAGRHLDRGLQVLREEGEPGTKVLVGYSQDFVAADKCKTVAENQIAQGAQVLFQVAGGCGLGTLKAADEAGTWGIGVDVDQYKLAKRVLTSGVKRVDNGVYQAIQQVQAGKFAGRHRPGLQPEERRHRRRQDQPGRAEGVHQADELLSRRRSSSGSSRSRASSKATEQRYRGAGRGARPRLARSRDVNRVRRPRSCIDPRQWTPPRSSRCGASRSAFPGRRRERPCRFRPAQGRGARATGRERRRASRP